MKHTQNYGFQKPEYEDGADIGVLGESLEAVDAQLKVQEDTLEELAQGLEGAGDALVAHSGDITAHPDMMAAHNADIGAHSNLIPKGGVIYDATCTKSGNVFTLAGLPATLPNYFSVRFKAPATFAEGNTFSVGGTTYTPMLTSSADPMPDDAFVAGAVLTVDADRVGQRINFKSGGGGKPKPPTSWDFLQAYTSSGTFTPPEVGWYRVFCIGRSGNGGGVPTNTGRGGNGGGAGGLSASLVFLKDRDTVSVTISSTMSSFGAFLSASSGKDGGQTTSAAIGGVGYDGNYANRGGGTGGMGGERVGASEDWPSGNGGTAGGNGGAAGGVAGRISSGYGKWSYAGGSGGGGGARLGGSDVCSYVSAEYTSSYRAGAGGWSGSYAVENATTYPTLIVSPSLKLYGGGSGAGSRAVGSDMTAPNGGSASTGSPGIIIIEKGVYI